MRLFDWTTALFVLGIVVGTASAAVLAFFGVGFVSGAATTVEGEVVNDPYIRTMGIMLLVGAMGCALCAGYCTRTLWVKYHEWRRWLRSKPGYPSWSITKEAEERRKRS